MEEKDNLIWNNEVMSFVNDQFGEVRTIVKDNNIWFAATDVCQILGLTNVTMALKGLQDYERSKFNLGRQGNGNFISESGFYTLVLRSRKPIATPFRLWVTSEVIPQIRLTGGYIPVEENDDEKVILAKAMKILQRTLEEKEELIKMQQPKVDAYNRLCYSEKSHEMKDACKVLDYGRNKLFAKLRADGYLMSDNTPYQKYVTQGLFKERITPTTHGRTYHVTLMTDKGITYFDRLFNSGKAVNP